MTFVEDALTAIARARLVAERAVARRGFHLEGEPEAVSGGVATRARRGAHFLAALGFDVVDSYWRLAKLADGTGS